MQGKKDYRKLLKKILVVGAGFFLLGVIFTVFVNVYILKTSESYISNELDDIPEAQAVMILGAFVFNDGRMSDILNDRVISALEIYNSGKVSKILVSGDHGREAYDEVNTIKNALIKEGVREDDIFLDHAGFDTYDSLYRARDIFELDSLVVVTQEFHLPRSIYLSKALGIETYGYVADKQPYLDRERNEIREVFARIKAFFNVIFHSKPRFLGERIPIEGNGRKSWD